MPRVDIRDQERLTFLRHFFHSENAISSQLNFYYDSVDTKNDKLAFLIKRFDEQRMTALPYVTLQSCKWMGIPGRDQSTEDFASLLNCFVVPSYGGSTEAKTPEQVKELFVSYISPKEILPKGYVIWRGAKETFENTCLALKLGFNLIDQRPSLARLRPRPAFEVLRDFQEAVMSRNWETAKSLLKEIDTRYLTSQPNQEFLRIQLYEAMGRWPEIINLPNLADITSMHLPILVRKAIVKAVYYSNHSEFERLNDYIHSLDKFYENQTLYAGILRGIEPGSFWIFDRLLAYRSVAINDKELFNRLLSLANDVDKPVLEEIRRLLPHEPAPKSIFEPMPSLNMLLLCAQKIVDLEYEEAFTLAQKIEDPIESVKMLIRVAYEGGNLIYVYKARQAFKNLREEDQLRILGIPFYQNKATELNLKELGLQVYDWIDWVKFVLENPSEIGIIREKAKELKDSWNTSNWKGFQGEKFPELLLDAITKSSQIQQIISESYPLILASFIEEDDFPKNQLLDSYKALFEVAIQTMPCSKERCRYVIHLAEGIFRLDPNFNQNFKKGYLDWINSNLKDLNRAFAESLYEIIELLIEMGVPPEELTSIWITITTFLSKLPGITLSNAQISLWRSIANYCKVPESTIETCFPPREFHKEDHPEDEVLSSARLTIFSLIRQSAERVANILKNIYPKIDVRVNSDLVVTDRLIKLAKNSDAVVLVTQAMKHAAFNEINSLVNTDKIIYPQGRGSSSILEAIIEWARFKK